MRTLFDVNFLVAMFDEEHVHHERAHQWWDANRADGWASCPLTQNGFVRVLSQSTTRTKVSPAAALDLLRTAIGEEGHEFWPDDISLLDPRRFNSTRVLGPRYMFANPSAVAAVALVVLLQVLAVHLPALTMVLQTRPLDAGDWIAVLALSGVSAVLGQAFKRRPETP